MVKKKILKKKRNEIRVIDIPDKVFNSVVSVAKQNDRTIGKEILNLIKHHY